MRETVPVGILSLRFWNEAKAYLLAAETLIREGQVGLPTYFLLSHAFELTIKAYLAAHGVDAPELKKIGHDLERGYERAVSLGLSVDINNIGALVRLVSNFHMNYVFRYPIINKQGDLVIVGTLVKAEDILEIVTAIWRLVEASAVHARLVAASEGGQYPIEEWHMGDPKPI
jgi:HEPN domain-containing protein